MRRFSFAPSPIDLTLLGTHQTQSNTETPNIHTAEMIVLRVVERHCVQRKGTPEMIVLRKVEGLA